MEPLRRQMMERAREAAGAFPGETEDG